MAYYPGMTASEANRYNVLETPYYYLGARALLDEQSDSFIEDYKFDIRPATDDRPYFFNFFKWSALQEIVSLMRRGGSSLLELGYPVLVVTLIQALLISFVLILVPLLFLKKTLQLTRPAIYNGSMLLYFAAIGLAFLFIEIVFIQKFMLFLTHPIYAVAVVLGGFLVFSGLGSAYSGRYVDAEGYRQVPKIVVLICLFASLYLWLLPGLFSLLATWPMPLKMLATLIVIAPLAFVMGMPFPLGLSEIVKNAPPLVPWAWGINGCASLISAILATLLAIHIGYNLVVLLALLLYLVAAVAGYYANRS